MEKITGAFKSELELKDSINDVSQFLSILSRALFFVNDIKREFAESDFLSSGYVIKQKQHIKEKIDDAVGFYRSVGKEEEVVRLKGLWGLYESMLDNCQRTLIQIKHIVESILPVIEDSSVVNLDPDRKKLLEQCID